MTNDRTAELVQAYYGSWKNGIASFDEARVRDILAPDLEFEGPIAGKRTGAEPFIKGLARFVESRRDHRVLQEVQGGNEAACLYDADLPGGTMRFAEFFRVEGDRIQSIKLVYDADQYRTLGGR